jgi:hypothetical protein
MLVACVLVLGLAGQTTAGARAPTAAEAELVSGVVAATVASDVRFEVLTAADVRTATDFEATKQQMGCTESSCLLELANALDARFVVSGVLGVLGEELVLQLSTLDVKQARSVGRQSLRGKDITSVTAQAETAIAATFAKAAGPQERNLRVVILDFTLASTSTSTTAAEVPVEPGLSGMVVGGGAAVGVGMLALVAGVGFDVVGTQLHTTTTSDTTLSAADATAAYNTSDGYLVGAIAGYVVGGVLVAGGVVIVTLGLATE